MMSIYIAFKVNQRQITLQGDAEILSAFFESLSISNVSERGEVSRREVMTDAPALAARQTEAAPGGEGVKHASAN